MNSFAPQTTTLSCPTLKEATLFLNMTSPTQLQTLSHANTPLHTPSTANVSKQKFTPKDTSNGQHHTSARTKPKPNKKNKLNTIPFLLNFPLSSFFYYFFPKHNQSQPRWSQTTTSITSTQCGSTPSTLLHDLPHLATNYQ